MKLQLTKTELLPILSKHFGMTVEDIELEGFQIKGAATLLNAAISGLRYTSDQKIMAIKAIRECTSVNNSVFPYVMGLADAKWAIENWNAFIAFVTNNGRIPREGYNSGNLR